MCDPYTIKAQLCGGTLISKTLVLTAGHCAWHWWEEGKHCTAWRETIAFVGDHGIVEHDEEQMINIEQWIRHPDYKGTETVWKKLF